MEATRDWTTALLVTLVATFWLCTQWHTIAQSAPETCVLDGPKCDYDTLNLSGDGLQRLRASARDHSTTYQITVERLITPYPDGVLLQLLSEFVNEVTYEQYHERILRIPPNAMLDGLAIARAPKLRSLAVAAPNHQLTTLQIKYAGLTTIPEAFRNLRELQFLTLDNGVLETVSLDPFATSPKISSLACSINRITQLVPSRNASLLVPIVDLLLAYNLLEAVNGDFFRPLHMLKYVTLEGNRMQRFEGDPISLPQAIYINLVQNQLAQLDVSGWHVPRLLELYLESNNLTRVPVGIERLPNLTTLVLQNNLLTVVDLRRFDGWTKLQKIDLSGNRLRNIFVSGTGRITLPNVLMIQLATNQLTRLEYGSWDLPRLETLTIAFNQFRHLPDLFQIFPKLRRVFAFQNPLHCGTVRRWQQYIVDYKLSVDTTAFGIRCTTNSSVFLPSGREVCCMG